MSPASSENRWPRYAVIAFVAMAISATALLRAQAIAGKRWLTHDDAIAYMAATCHQGEFHRVDYGLDAVPASRWKKFIRLDRRFCFGAIASGLRDFDIHPPLYFWFLHIWFLILGVTLASGAALNVLISAFTVVSLFGLSRYLLKNDVEAVLVTMTYALSPAVVSISVEARPYDLLGLWVVLAVWATARATDASQKLQRSQLSWLAIVMTAGSLTHYHFLFIVIACLAVATVRLGRSDQQRWLRTSGAILLGYLVGFLLHPPLGLFGRAALHNQPFDVAELTNRWSKVAGSFEPFAYLLVPFALLAAALALYAAARRRIEPGHPLQFDGQGLWVLLIALWVSLATVTLFLAFLSPAHAMSPKYLVAAWPFLAFLAVAVYRAIPLNQPVLIYLFAVPLVFGLLMPLTDGVPQRVTSNVAVDAKLVFIDTRGSGVLPRIVQSFPDEMPVIAAWQDRLLERPEAWLEQLPDRSLYISHNSYGNTGEKMGRLLGLIRAASFEAKHLRREPEALGIRFSVRTPD